jgi:hypothetical protein
MYYRAINGKVIGVLNDCDLVSLADTPGRSENKRTGAIPFMAIDLLKPDGQAGLVKHIYRHDMESFIWVFIWLCFQYKDGKFHHGPLDEWAKVDADQCAAKKNFFLSYPQKPSYLTHAGWFRLNTLGNYLAVRSYFRVHHNLKLSAAQSLLAIYGPTAEHQEEIKRLEAKLVEESDDVVFDGFIGKIDAVASAVVDD